MTIESLYKAAFQDVLRNWAPLLLYVAVYLVFVTTSGCLTLALVGPPDNPNPPSWAWSVNMADQLLGAAIIALMQTLVFSVVGAEIDKPLWKLHGAGEAIRRFFPLWLVANLIGTALFQLTHTAESRDATDVMGVLLITSLIYQCLALPVVTALMYAARDSKPEVGDSLGPLLHHAGPTLSVLGVALLALLLGITFEVLLEPYGMTQLRMVLRGLSVAPLAALEFFMFVVVWRICMFHRDNATHNNTDYFDF